MKAEAETAKVELTKAQEAELERVCKSEAASVRLIGVADDDLAEALFALKKSDAALAEQMLAILRTAHEQVKKSGLFDILGSSAPAPDSVQGRVLALAEELVTKSEGKLSLEQAKAQIWKSEPELFAEYSKEHQDRKKG